MGQEENKNKAKKIAVALGYNAENDLAPRVLASGKGRIAEKIVEAAVENYVPVQHNEVLALSLGNLAVGEIIPEELYEAVAKILAFLVNLDKKNSNK